MVCSCWRAVSSSRGAVGSISPRLRGVRFPWLQSAARQAGVEVTTRFVPSYVAGDPDLLERLAGNLIDNAIRYNRVDRGWVIVTVSSERRVRMVIRRELWTCDPGVGRRRHIRAVPPPALRRPNHRCPREPGRPAAPDWACRSCARSPPRTTVTSVRWPAPTAGSPSRLSCRAISSCGRCRRPAASSAVCPVPPANCASVRFWRLRRGCGRGTTGPAACVGRSAD